MGLTKTFSTKVDSQNAHKMPNFRYPLSAENGMSFYNESYPLLMKCFQTFLRCIRQMGGASLCISLPLKGLTELLCSTKVDSQNTNKMQVCKFWVSSQYGKYWVLNYEERHPQHMNRFKTCLRCRRNMKEVVGSIYQPLMSPTVRFPTTVDSQIAHKILDFQ